MSTPNAVYSALYDIGREKIDGRMFKDYKMWLKKTTTIFPGMYIFHDGNLTDFENLDCYLIELPLSDLEIFKKLDLVTKILQKFKPIATSDITFKTPLYSLVQFAKFELAYHLRARIAFDSVLWVDAGISRFLEKVDHELLIYNSKRLIDEGKETVFEIDLRRNIDLGKLSIKNPNVGTCKRVISGTSFWINNDFLNEFNYLVNSKLEEWIDSGVWDNEQILIRKLLAENQINSKYILQNRNLTGSVARTLGSRVLSKNDLTNKIISRMLH